MEFTDLGRQIDWVPKRIQEDNCLYYFIKENIPAEKVYDSVESILTKKGFEYVYAEKTIMYFEKTDQECRTYLYQVRNQTGYNELDDILRNNKIDNKGFKSGIILAVETLERKVI